MDLTLDEVKSLTDLDEIQKIFLQLRIEEETASRQLDDLLANQAHLETKMQNLNQILPGILSVKNGCKSLHETIIHTNDLAVNVSKKVRQLDSAKGHVDECISRVNDIISLKGCAEGVQSAMIVKDYEKAANFINKYLVIDKKFNFTLLDDDVTGSFAVLKETQLTLVNIISKNMDEAIRSDDREAVHRYIRLYPLVDRHSEGLTKYSKYMSGKVAEVGQKHLGDALKTSKQDARWNVTFADTITKLYEDTARLIEDSSTVVQNYNGSEDCMKYINHVHDECVRQARGIINNFLQIRNVLDMVMYTSSMADENSDVKKIDQILDEMVTMNARAELYINFIQRKLKDNVNNEWDNAIRTLQQETMGHYIALETYFMKTSINKAVSMETREKNSLVSSLVDDVCFVIQKIINRSLNSKNSDAICAMINNSISTLSLDVCGQLSDIVVNGYPNVNTFSWQQGTDEQVHAQKERFFTCLNNCHGLSENVNKLRKGFELKCDKLFGDKSHLQKILSCIHGFGDVYNDFKEVVKKGEHVICKSALFPKLHPVLAEFASSSHVISEDQFYILEVEDPWLQDIFKVIEDLSNPLLSILNQNIYDSVLSLTISEVSQYLEKLVLTCSFNQLGGLLFDKRLRSLVTFLSTKTQWSVRDKFIRLTQLALLLSSERLSEVSEYLENKMISRLGITELKQALKIRIDYKNEDIDRDF